MLRSPESKRRASVSLLLITSLGLAACGGGEGTRDEGSAKSTAATREEAGPTIVTPAPRNDMRLKAAPVDAEGHERAWTPQDPQPFGKNNTVQIDSRATKPVGGPVGVYAAPEQMGNSPYDVKDGEEYKAVCVTEGQYNQNDFRDGSDKWLGLDLDFDGKRDGYVPVTQVGFTGEIQPDPPLPVCR